MSNKRDMEPSLDFFELRRRHEEYKNSQRQAKAAAEADAAADAKPSMMEKADAPARNALREIVMSLDPFLRNDAYIIAVSPRARNP